MSQPARVLIAVREGMSHEEVEQSQTPKPSNGTHMLSAVYEWDTRVALHIQPKHTPSPDTHEAIWTRGDAHVTLHLDPMPEWRGEIYTGAQAAEWIMKNVDGGRVVYWQTWAKIFLMMHGLPASEDGGERNSAEDNPAFGEPTEESRRVGGLIGTVGSRPSIMAYTYADNPANRLIRAWSRFNTGSAEAWAAQIEWCSVTGKDGGVAAAVERLVGMLRAAREQAKVTLQRKNAARKPRGFAGLVLPDLMKKAEKMVWRSDAKLARDVQRIGNQEREQRIKQGLKPGPKVPANSRNIERQIRKMRTERPRSS